MKKVTKTLTKVCITTKSTKLRWKSIRFKRVNQLEFVHMKFSQVSRKPQHNKNFVQRTIHIFISNLNFL